MNVLVFGGGIALAAFFAYLLTKKAATIATTTKDDDDDDDDVREFSRTRGRENEISLWDEAWEITSERGLIKFELGVKKSNGGGGGVIVALAEQWKHPEAGGVAAVLNDCYTGIIIGEEVKVSSRSYFAELPFLNQPSHQSTTAAFNHRVGGKYVLSWSPRGVKLMKKRGGNGGGGDILIETTQKAGRYLAFGSYGPDSQSCSTESNECAHRGVVKNVRIIVV